MHAAFLAMPVDPECGHQMNIISYRSTTLEAITYGLEAWKVTTLGLILDINRYQSGLLYYIHRSRWSNQISRTGKCCFVTAVKSLALRCQGN